MSYGGVFHINRTWITNPIRVGAVGSNKAFTLNITIWSPYGVADRIEVNISDLARYLYNGSLYETYDPNNLFESVGYSLTTNGGWVYFILKMKPTWNAGGNYDIWVYAEDAAHGYTNSSLYPSLFTVVNNTFLYSYSFNKTTYFPSDPASLTLKISYNSTSVGVEGETLWVNGTQLVTNASGYAVYNFTAPATSGDYMLNVTLAHGETYFINFTVSKIILHLYVKTTTNSTIHLPSNLLIQLYNYTTNELLREFSGKESMDIYLNETGEYLIKFYYHGILIAEVFHNQTQLEQSLTVTPIKQVVDYLGKLRGLISNATLLTHNYDNVSRKLHLELGGIGIGRLVYIVNYSKPLLVISNTTVLNEQQLTGEIVVDVEVPANITIIDPRRLKVTVENPFNVSYTPSIEFLNGTVWATLSNATPYEVPAYSSTQIKVAFKGVEYKKYIPLLEDLNLTIELPYVTFGDYRGITRELISNMSMSFENLSSKFPYSRMTIKVSGTGGFIVKMNLTNVPTALGINANTTITWRIENGWLIIEGSLHSTSEINITDKYKFRLELYDRLGNLMPVQPSIYINNTKYVGNIIEKYLYPENYTIKVQSIASGFQFYEFFDGYNESTRTITINNTDITLKVWYRVPTSLESEVKYVGSVVTSWFFWLAQESQTEAQVYIEGMITDYYGNGLPSKQIIVNITNPETGFTLSLNATTDVTGYFKTDIIRLVRGKQYEVKTIYQGDDTYVESISTKYFTIEAPPAPIEVIGIPTEYIIAIIIAILIVTAIALFAWRAAKHVIHDEFAKRRKFVKRKK